MSKVCRLTGIAALLLVFAGIGGPRARADLDIREGTYGGNTYTLALEESGDNGHLIVLIPAIDRLLGQDAFADNRIVTAHTDLANLGYVVAALDATRYPALNLEERPAELRDFALQIKQTLGLGGDIFLAGAPGTGTLVHLMMDRYPGDFAGGVAVGGITDIADQLEFLRYQLMERTFTFEETGTVIESIQALQQALAGPVVDRATGTPNPRLLTHSPASSLSNIQDVQIIIHGDADLERPVFHHWRYLDAMVAGGKKTKMINFAVPNGGQFAPGVDVEGYYGDMILECIIWAQEGTPPQYEPGKTYGTRAISDERVPSAGDPGNIDMMSGAPIPASLDLQARAGHGSRLGGWNNTVRLRNLDLEDDLEILFGDSEGFVHIMKFQDGTLHETWRSDDLGMMTYAVDATPQGSSAADQILVGNFAGEIWKITGSEQYVTEQVYIDPLGQPILDLEIARIGAHPEPVALVRTFDGYVLALELSSFTIVARSPFLGPTIGLGMDVSDQNGDGLAEIVVGVADSSVLLLDTNDLSVRHSSGPLGVFPFEVNFTNVFGQAMQEVIVAGGTDPTRRDNTGVNVILSPQLGEIKRTRQLAGYDAFAAKDLDGESTDDLLLGCPGRLMAVDLPTKSVRSWSHPAAERITGLAHDDLDGDGSIEIVVTTDEGSIHVVDHDSMQTIVGIAGITGAYGTILTQVTGDASVNEVLLGRRPSGLFALEGAHLSIAATFPTPNHWAHTLDIGDIDRNAKREWIFGTGNGIAERTSDLDGFIYSMRNDGSISWTTRNPEEEADNVDGSLWGLSVADFDFDSTPEIIVANDVTPSLQQPGMPLGLSRVRIYDGQSEALEAELEIEGHDLHSLATGDVTGDGQLDIVVGDRRGYIHVLSSAEPHSTLGKIYQSSDLGTSIVGLEVVDLDGILPLEVLCGNEEGVVRVLRWDGKDLVTIAQTDKLGSHTWGFTTGNLIGDRTAEIVAGNANGDLYIFDAGLQFIVSYPGLGAFVGAYGSMHIGNVDSDLARELVVSSSGYVYVFELSNPLTSGNGNQPQVGGDPTGWDHGPPPPN